MTSSTSLEGRRQLSRLLPTWTMMMMRNRKPDFAWPCVGFAAPQDDGPSAHVRQHSPSPACHMHPLRGAGRRDHARLCSNDAVDDFGRIAQSIAGEVGVRCVVRALACPSNACTT